MILFWLYFSGLSSRIIRNKYSVTGDWSQSILFISVFYNIKLAAIEGTNSLRRHFSHFVHVLHIWSSTSEKRAIWHMRPVKIQISLRIRAVWSEFSLGAFWIAKVAKFLHADNENSDQTARIWVVVGAHVRRYAFSCCGIQVFWKHQMNRIFRNRTVRRAPIEDKISPRIGSVG